MARTLTWRSVRGGAFALLAIVAASVAILVYARVGVLRGRTFRLYIATQEARGVIPGTEVWLSGQKVGRVNAIRFGPPESDTTERVLLETEIVDKHRDVIRLNSESQIQTGGTIIGAPIVNLTAGTLAARAVVDGDTLRSKRQADVERLTGDLSAAAAQLPALMSDARAVATLAQASFGQARSLLADGGSGARAAQQLRTIQARMSGRTGTIGKLRDPNSALAARARHAMAAADTVRRLLATRSLELGRFRRDSTLLTSIAELREEVAAVRALAQSSEGTVGRLRSDSAIFVGMDSLYAEMAALFADIRKRPLRYIVF